MVLNILAKNKPGACSVANIAEIKEITYILAINITPIKELIRFILFILDNLSFHMVSLYKTIIYKCSDKGNLFYYMINGLKSF